MLRITRQSDYAIALTSAMSRNADRVWSSAELARITGLPYPMVAKILKILHGSGILATKRGVKGGYRLAREPSSISVAEIIESVEGPIALTDCVRGRGLCDYEKECVSRSSWAIVNRKIYEVLSSISIAEMRSEGG